MRESSSPSVNKIIIEEHVKYDVPADQIPSDPQKAVEFQRRVNNRLSDSQQFEIAELNKTLINLRRRGEANGGLPRLRRRYDGRHHDRN